MKREREEAKRTVPVASMLLYSVNRFDYIKYWENKKEEIDEKIANIKNTALLPELANEAKRIEIISLNIGEFISKLKDGLGKNL